MCPVFLWQQPQVCNRLCFLDIFSTLQVISICSDSRESWWHNKGSLDCWTTQICDSNERGRTKECLGWTTENKTNWSNEARTQTGMFCCAFQWYADSKIQSPTNKCTFLLLSIKCWAAPPSFCHSLFICLNCTQWFDYRLLSRGKEPNILLMVASVHVIERHSKAHGTQFCGNSQIQEQGFHRGPLYTEWVH